MALAMIAAAPAVARSPISTDEAVAAPEVRALYPRIHRHPVDKAEGEFPTEVEVVLEGRHDASRPRCAMPVGSLAAPFTERQYWRQVRRAAPQRFMPPGRAGGA